MSSQMTYLPRPSVCYPHSVQPSSLQRSSDDDDPGSRSPPLEVSDEECMRDHITSTTGGEHGKDKGKDKFHFADMNTRIMIYGKRISDANPSQLLLKQYCQ